MPSTSLVSQIANEFVSDGSEDVVDIVSFIESSWGLGLTLWPVQRFIFKATYGLPLDDQDRCIEVPDMVAERVLYTFTEKEYLKWLYEEGRCNTDDTEGKNFFDIIYVMGRRSGKSTIAACISNYEIYKLIKMFDPGGTYGRKGASIAFLNVAPTDEQANIVFEMTKSMAINCHVLRDRSLHQTQRYFDIQTDLDIQNAKDKRPRASIESISGGCSANSLRGHNAIVVILDEMAFFIDNSGRFSGDEVHRALTPSVASFGSDGKVICSSSPYAKFGKFYFKYLESFDEPDTTLMLKLYSSMVNPTISSTLLKTKRRRNRVDFMSEFGAEFSDSITAWIDDEQEFRACINVAPKTRGVSDVAYFYGVDLGFRNDGTAIAIVHKEDDTIVLDYADVWYPGTSDIWDRESSIYHECDRYSSMDTLRVCDAITEIEELVKWFPPKLGVFDQVNGYAFEELIHKAGLTQFEMVNFTEAINDRVFKLAKRLYAEKLISLYDHPVLIPELISLEEERVGGRAKEANKDKDYSGEVSKGKSKVRAPERPGAHDDISDAWARAVWKCHDDTIGRVKKVSTGAAGKSGLESVITWRNQKMRMHGDHPRGAYRSKRKFPGSGR